MAKVSSFSFLLVLSFYPEKLTRTQILGTPGTIFNNIIWAIFCPLQYKTPIDVFFYSLNLKRKQSASKQNKVTFFYLIEECSLDLKLCIIIETWDKVKNTTILRYQNFPYLSPTLTRIVCPI